MSNEGGYKSHPPVEHRGIKYGQIYLVEEKYECLIWGIDVEREEVRIVTQETGFTSISIETILKSKLIRDQGDMDFKWTNKWRKKGI